MSTELVQVPFKYIHILGVSTDPDDAKHLLVNHYSAVDGSVDIDAECEEGDICMMFTEMGECEPKGRTQAEFVDLMLRLGFVDGKHPVYIDISGDTEVKIRVDGSEQGLYRPELIDEMLTPFDDHFMGVVAEHVKINDKIKELGFTISQATFISPDGHHYTLADGNWHVLPANQGERFGKGE